MFRIETSSQTCSDNYFHQLNWKSSFQIWILQMISSLIDLSFFLFNYHASFKLNYNKDNKILLCAMNLFKFYLLVLAKPIWNITGLFYKNWRGRSLMHCNQRKVTAFVTSCFWSSKVHESQNGSLESNKLQLSKSMLLLLQNILLWWSLTYSSPELKSHKWTIGHYRLRKRFE